MKSKHMLKAAVILLFVSACGLFYLRVPISGESFVKKEEFDDEIDVPDETVSAEIVVHVCGAVMYEGVYVLPQGSRVVDAIEAAGGLSENAVGAAVNQAGFLSDGSRLYIPYQEDPNAAAGMDDDVFRYMTSEENASEISGSEGGKVNLNRAGKEELLSLPGIGESKAEAILSYRKEYGLFQTVEDLMKVPGIKEGVFQKVKNSITVE